MHTAIITPARGKSLGSVTEVKAQLAKAFPGISFAMEKKVYWTDLLIGWPPRKFRMSLIGSFEEDGSAAQFNLGSSEEVAKIHVSLFGLTIPLENYFDALRSNAGWVVPLGRPN